MVGLFINGVALVFWILCWLYTCLFRLFGYFVGFVSACWLWLLLLLLTMLCLVLLDGALIIMVGFSLFGFVFGVAIRFWLCVFGD